jgi:hypothetical protein
VSDESLQRDLARLGEHVGERGCDGRIGPQAT